MKEIVVGFLKRIDTKAIVEAAKEVGRLVLSAAISAAVTVLLSEMTRLIGLVPDPTLQGLLFSMLTLFSRALDKFKFIKSKNEIEAQTVFKTQPSGLYPF